VRYVCPDCGASGDAGGCARDGTARAPVGSDPVLGTTIGSWRVARILGIGGMGRVYAAVQPEIGARVAIKILKREHGDAPEHVERFFNEARAVNLIRHDNIVDVIDLGRLPGGEPYIVMEYLDGVTLLVLVRRQLITLGTLGKLLGDVLAALEAAHAKGVVHRDLKPENVFVSPTGRVTVLDFGIAKLANLAQGTPTQTGMLLGTPAYMSPEQTRSLPLDARSDLYSVGVMLYEGATGAVPFIAASLYDVLDMHVRTPPAPPRTLNPAIPVALERVILRALEKDPANRFASAAEMRAALAAAIADLPAPLPEIATEPQRVRRSDPQASTAIAPEPLRWKLAVVAGLGLAVVVTAAIAIARRDDAPPVVAQGPLDAAAPDAKIVDAPSPGDAPVVVMLETAPRDAGTKPPKPKGRPKLTKAEIDMLAERPALVAIKNPKAFAPFAYYKTALAEAQRVFPNVWPSALNFGGVDRNGKVDVTKEDVRYTFATDDPAAGKYCMVVVTFEKGIGWIARGSSSGGCRSSVAPPRCAPAELWRRATDGGLPAAATHARFNRINRGWQFSSGEFRTHLVDDC
jgi:hypothetical protein